MSMASQRVNNYVTPVPHLMRDGSDKNETF